MVSAKYIEKDEHEPIHHMFGLTYSNYLVLQRSLLQAMPLDWQHRFTTLIAEMEDEFDTDRLEVNHYQVNAINESGRFIKDPLRNYRYPDRELIESLRRSKEPT